MRLPIMLSHLLKYSLFSVGAMLGVKAAAAKLKKFRWVESSNSTHPHNSLGGGPFLLPAMNNADIFHHRVSQLGAERIDRTVQKVSSGIIAGTWVQTVYNSAGHPVFHAGSLYESVPRDLEPRVNKMRSEEGIAVQLLKDTVPVYRTASYRYPLDIEIVLDQNVAALYWLADFVSKDETRFYQARLDVNMHLISVREVGHGGVEGRARVFPRGPAQTDLQDVVLSDLEGTGRLQTPKLKVQSAKSELNSPDHDFRFNPEDSMFGQVQAFFHADRILHWFQDSFGASPYSRLEIKVQVGENSNAAFYYRNKIRLGSGDGQRYHNMSQDPTVVMHEVSHAIVERYAALPSQGEGGALNEAFADFFTACILDRPYIGESSYLEAPFVRSLENDYRATTDLENGMYRASQVVSATFWDLRIALGVEVAQTLAFRTLGRLGPAGDFRNLAPTLVMASEGFLDDLGMQRLQEILRARGWTEWMEGAGPELSL